MNRSLSLGLAMALLLAGARAQVADQYRVKAAFLHNFAKFVEWPESAFRGPSESLSICIAGENPFGDALAHAVQGETKGGHPLAVRLIDEPGQLAGCHILFIPDSQHKRFSPGMEFMRGRGMLTVGETPGFAQEGGMINLKVENGHVRFQINPGTVLQGKLIISSKLLSLAEIVGK